jgi:hypothetical protein
MVLFSILGISSMAISGFANEIVQYNKKFG